MEKSVKKKKQLELNYFVCVLNFKKKCFGIDSDAWYGRLTVPFGDSTLTVLMPLELGEEFETAETRIKETIAILFHPFSFCSS